MPSRHRSDQPQPFLHLLNSTAASPTAVALSSEHREFTFEELQTHSARLAGYLQERGVQPGDVVGVSTSNDLQVLFMLALFATRAIGCTFPAKIEHHSGPPLDWYLAHEFNAAIPADQTIIIDDQLMADAASLGKPLDLEPYDSPDSICRIIYSSGTTGQPIAIPISVATLEARAELIERHWMPHFPFMSLIPIAGSHGVYAVINAMARANTYFAPSNPTANLKLLQDNFIGSAIGSVAQLEALCDVLETSNGSLPDLAFLYSTGTTMPQSLVRRLRQFTDAPIESLYGATEIGPVSSAGFNDHGVVEFPKPLDHVKFEIVNECDEQVEIGTIGVVRIRTTTQVPGYLGSDDRSTSFRDGFFYPGDLGVMKDDGSFSLVGRATEVANLGGVKVDPSLVDDVVRSIDGVQDAAFFVVKSTKGADRGFLAIVCDETTAQRALKVAQEKVYGLEVDTAYRVDAIPRTEHGKVRRVELAERFVEEFGER